MNEAYQLLSNHWIQSDFHPCFHGKLPQSLQESLTGRDLELGAPHWPLLQIASTLLTDHHLCSPQDNVYNINLSRFKIRDLDSGTVLLDIKKTCPTGLFSISLPGTQRDRSHHVLLVCRFIHISLRLELTVGSRALNRFRLIERHFFRNLLLQTFRRRKYHFYIDFEIGFCIPNSRNTCEHIYCLPDLDTILVEEMTSNPFETRSDSFYFVKNKLTMHHKAEHSFTPTPDASTPGWNSSSAGQ
nr:LOW QUALITY PROTEIN: protein unc-119 homolog B-B-like [Nothobranchius furzeri]